MRSQRTSTAQYAFTLIELLIVVVILGIAGALVIPSMGEAGVLRVQGAIRSIVADITFAQADAVAFQERRAVCFDLTNSTYAVVAIPGSTIDIANNTLYDTSRSEGKYACDLKDPRFGNTRVASADFGAGSRNLIFDALGGPVATPSGNTPGPGGTIRITGMNQAFIITVEAFTGRVSVARE